MDISVENIGDVALVRWNDGQNRINLDSIARIRTIFNELAERDGQLAVVWTGADKFFSNGLDLDWMMAHVDEGGPALVANGLQALYRRLVTFPTATVAAVTSSPRGRVRRACAPASATATAIARPGPQVFGGPHRTPTPAPGTPTDAGIAGRAP